MNNQPSTDQYRGHETDHVLQNLRKRRAAEARFKWIGRAAIGLAMSFLAILFITIFRFNEPVMLIKHFFSFSEDITFIYTQKFILIIY